MEVGSFLLGWGWRHVLWQRHETLYDKHPWHGTPESWVSSVFKCRCDYVTRGHTCCGNKSTTMADWLVTLHASPLNNQTPLIFALNLSVRVTENLFLCITVTIHDQTLKSGEMLALLESLPNWRFLASRTLATLWSLDVRHFQVITITPSVNCQVVDTYSDTCE